MQIDLTDLLNPHLEKWHEMNEKVSKIMLSEFGYPNNVEVMSMRSRHHNIYTIGCEHLASVELSIKLDNSNPMKYALDFVVKTKLQPELAVKYKHLFE